MDESRRTPEVSAAAERRPGARSRRASDRRKRDAPVLGEVIAAADRRLVRTCLRGSERAWSDLVDRYQSLVYAIVLESSTGREDPAGLWADVWREILARLGEPESQADFCSWVVSLTLERCGISPPHADEDSLGRLLEAQRLRCCLAELPSPCHKVLSHLFAAPPARSAEGVARSLGIPPEDWSAVRRLCFERLRRVLRRCGIL